MGKSGRGGRKKSGYTGEEKKSIRGGKYLRGGKTSRVRFWGRNDQLRRGKKGDKCERKIPLKKRGQKLPKKVDVALRVLAANRRRKKIIRRSGYILVTGRGSNNKGHAPGRPAYFLPKREKPINAKAQRKRGGLN